MAGCGPNRLCVVTVPSTSESSTTITAFEAAGPRKPWRVTSKYGGDRIASARGYAMLSASDGGYEMYDADGRRIFEWRAAYRSNRPPDPCPRRATWRRRTPTRWGTPCTWRATTSNAGGRSAAAEVIEVVSSFATDCRGLDAGRRTGGLAANTRHLLWQSACAGTSDVQAILSAYRVPQAVLFFGGMG
jgi:hypothetical protein